MGYIVVNKIKISPWSCGVCDLVRVRRRWNNKKSDWIICTWWAKFQIYFLGEGYMQITSNL